VGVRKHCGGAHDALTRRRAEHGRMNSTASTSFTRLVGCDLPIQLAPMSGPVGTELVTAVARAGAHAVYPAVMVGPVELDAAIDRMRAATGAFGVNFIAPLMDPECLELAATRAPLVDLFYADPDRRTVERIHAGGALASWQVGSLEEAMDAADAGCDVVVVQGSEAGGRIRGQLELLTLLERVAGRLEVPVVAAGGMATADDAARAIEAGADAVRIGTRFIAAQESNAHPAWQRALIDAGVGDAVITRAFALGVPDFPHRVLRTSLEAARALGAEPFPPDSPTRSVGGSVDGMPFYAGMSSAAVDRVQPAADIVADLAAHLVGATAA
jgi:nitronate monooxygenase